MYNLFCGSPLITQRDKLAALRDNWLHNQNTCKMIHSQFLSAPGTTDLRTGKLFQTRQMHWKLTYSRSELSYKGLPLEKQDQKLNPNRSEAISPPLAGPRFPPGCAFTCSHEKVHCSAKDVLGRGVRCGLDPGFSGNKAAL